MSFLNYISKFTVTSSAVDELFRKCLDEKVRIEEQMLKVQQLRQSALQWENSTNASNSKRKPLESTSEANES